MAVTCSPKPSNLVRKDTRFFTLLPRHWGARASFGEINFSSLFRVHGVPTLRGQPRPTGQQNYWEAHEQELECRPFRKKAGLFQEHKEQSLGRDRLCMLIDRCWESMGPILGEGRGRPEPALAGI